jgi:diguanylate cyclase (GGDEF)-like protein
MFLRGLRETVKDVLGTPQEVFGADAGQPVSGLHILGRATHGLRWWLAFGFGAAGFISLVWWLRQLSWIADPFFRSYLAIVGALLAFTYAANALVRFRGTHDRISLILALGFVLSGLIEMFSSLAIVGDEARTTIPLAWVAGRTILGALIIAALVVERRVPSSREPRREIAVALLVVSGVAYLTSVVLFSAPWEPAIRPGAWLPRAWDLIPAAIFAAATWGCWKRLERNATPFDYALCGTAALNVLCHLAATQSESMADAPLAFAHGLRVTSYALILCGALLDNARLFDQVREMSVSDALTGLANYRRFIEMLEAEVRRSERTGRTFAVLLLDLDGLKKINDQRGHVVGTRAICRVADVLRSHCRAMDTAARYGGDEFALVLPESNATAAWHLARRICERLENDIEQPRLAVSLGVAVFPNDGEKIDTLLSAADRVLYGMKGRRDKKAAIMKMAVGL